MTQEHQEEVLAGETLPPEGQETAISTKRAYHVKRITSRWQDSLEAILDVGRMVAEAKEDLDHGEFIEMIRTDLPFSDSTARRLKVIAEDPRISNRAHGHVLPPHWRSLYELTQVSDEVFHEGVENGLINPDMTRKQVSDLKSATPPSAGRRPSPPSPMVTLKVEPWLAKFIKEMVDSAESTGNLALWLQRTYPDPKTRPDPSAVAKALKKVPSAKQLTDQR
ncbi:MAG: DUF3102 domain-containing protein [Magnetococcales bacterium]|nr:DUF3102 domain-containing protein [Magnetococcales bacterium]